MGNLFCLKIVIPRQTNVTWAKQVINKYFSVDKWMDGLKGILSIMKHMERDLSPWLPFHFLFLSRQ